MVKDTYLTYLINAEKIDKFKRSEGWVSIYAPDIRGKISNDSYSGPERRIQAIVVPAGKDQGAVVSKNQRSYLDSCERASTIHPPREDSQ
jgi:hypothetical protein